MAPSSRSRSSPSNGPAFPLARHPRVFVERVKKLLGGGLPASAAMPSHGHRGEIPERQKPSIPTWFWALLAVVLIGGAVSAVYLRTNKSPDSAPAKPAEAVVTASPQIDEKSVAVLAFADLSEGHDNEYFSDSISEELLNVLAKVPGLKVSARTSAFSFKGKAVSIPEIARQPGVAYVVEGSVRKAGDRVRISAELIKAADGFHVWSDNFDRDLKDIFAVQDEIAGLIAGNLELKLGMEARKPGEINPEAYRLFLEARQALALRDQEHLTRAEDLLKKALALQPDFARADALLGDVLLVQGDLTDQGSGDNQFAALNVKILGLADRALALDPNLSEAYATKGAAYSNLGQATQARAAFRKSIELDPNYATGHQWYGRILSEDGYLDEALAELKRAVELDPLAPRILDNYAFELAMAGKYTESLALLARALPIQPDSIQIQTLKPFVLTKLGRNREALEIAETLRRRADKASYTDVYLAESFMAGGRRDEVEAMLSEQPSGFGSDFYRGLLLCALGRTEEARALLQPKISYLRDLLLWFPVIDPLRADPEFQRKLAEWGFADAHARAQAWRAAHPPEKPTAR
jgi:TolB-like protein